MSNDPKDIKVNLSELIKGWQDSNSSEIKNQSIKYTPSNIEPMNDNNINVFECMSKVNKSLDNIYMNILKISKIIGCKKVSNDVYVEQYSGIFTIVYKKIKNIDNILIKIVDCLNKK